MEGGRDAQLKITDRITKKLNPAAQMVWTTIVMDWWMKTTLIVYVPKGKHEKFPNTASPGPLTVATQSGNS